MPPRSTTLADRRRADPPVFAWLIDALLIGLLLAALWFVLLLFGLLTLGLGLPLLGVLPFVPFCYHLLFVAGPGSATPGSRHLG